MDATNAYLDPSKDTEQIHKHINNKQSEVPCGTQKSDSSIWVTPISSKFQDSQWVNRRMILVANHRFSPKSSHLIFPIHQTQGAAECTNDDQWTLMSLTNNNICVAFPRYTSDNCQQQNQVLEEQIRASSPTIR